MHGCNGTDHEFQGLENQTEDTVCMNSRDSSSMTPFCQIYDNTRKPLILKKSEVGQINQNIACIWLYESPEQACKTRETDLKSYVERKHKNI